MRPQDIGAGNDPVPGPTHRPYEVVGNRLRLARKATKLSQREVGVGLGLVGFTILRWERGDRLPSTEALDRLCSIYQVSMDWLMSGLGVDPQWDPRREATARALLSQFAGSLAKHRDRNSPDRPLSLKEAIWEAADRIRVEGSSISSSGASIDFLEAYGQYSERVQFLLESRTDELHVPGIHPEVLLALKKGQVLPSPRMAVSLAEAASIDEHWLLTGNRRKR